MLSRPIDPHSRKQWHTYCYLSLLAFIMAHLSTFNFERYQLKYTFSLYTSSVLSLDGWTCSTLWKFTEYIIYHHKLNTKYNFSPSTLSKSPCTAGRATTHTMPSAHLTHLHHPRIWSFFFLRLEKGWAPLTVANLLPR